MEVGRRSATAPAGPQPWYRAWVDAITKPRVEAYEALVSIPGISTGRAILWVFLSTVTSYGVVLLRLFATPTLDAEITESPALDLASSAVAIAGLLLFAGALAVIGLTISTAISHVVARALGGTGSFPQLAYAIAAYTAPLSLVTPVVALVPLINSFAFLLLLYPLFLNVVAIKAVHQLTWERALLSSVAMLACLIALAALLIGAALTLFGPTIVNLLSNTMKDLGVSTQPILWAA